jgi:hypothetical protein
MRKVLPPFHRFRTETRGAVAFEAVIILPVLIWCFTASFVFFDAYRVNNSSVMATYSVADVLSRQTNTVHGYDLQGYARVFQHLIRNGHAARLRVSQIYWDGSAYRVDWSHVTGNDARHFDATMGAIAHRIPPLMTNERVLLVESFVPYVPPFGMGLEMMTFDTFTVTRPRYLNQVPFDPTEALPAAGSN